MNNKNCTLHLTNNYTKTNPKYQTKRIKYSSRTRKFQGLLPLEKNVICKVDDVQLPLRIIDAKHSVSERLGQSRCKNRPLHEPKPGTFDGLFGAIEGDQHVVKLHGDIRRKRPRKPLERLRRRIEIRSTEELRMLMLLLLLVEIRRLVHHRRAVDHRIQRRTHHVRRRKRRIKGASGRSGG